MAASGDVEAATALARRQSRERAALRPDRPPPMPSIGDVLDEAQVLVGVRVAQRAQVERIERVAIARGDWARASPA